MAFKSFWLLATTQRQISYAERIFLAISATNMVAPMIANASPTDADVLAKRNDLAVLLLGKRLLAHFKGHTHANDQHMSAAPIHSIRVPSRCEADAKSIAPMAATTHNKGGTLLARCIHLLCAVSK